MPHYSPWPPIMNLEKAAAPPRSIKITYRGGLMLAGVCLAILIIALYNLTENMAQTSKGVVAEIVHRGVYDDERIHLLMKSYARLVLDDCEQHVRFEYDKRYNFSFFTLNSVCDILSNITVEDGAKVSVITPSVPYYWEFSQGYDLCTNYKHEGTEIWTIGKNNTPTPNTGPQEEPFNFLYTDTSLPSRIKDVYTFETCDVEVKPNAYYSFNFNLLMRDRHVGVFILWTSLDQGQTWQNALYFDGGGVVRDDNDVVISYTWYEWSYQTVALHTKTADKLRLKLQATNVGMYGDLAIKSLSVTKPDAPHPSPPPWDVYPPPMPTSD
jgi:hypothetical protein